MDLLVVCGHFCLFMLKVLKTGKSLEDTIFSLCKWIDKFGSHARQRVSVWQLQQDLSMNDNRITSRGHHTDSSNAVAKRWMTQQLKDGIKDINELETALEAISKELEAIKKHLNGIEKKSGE